MKNKYFLMFLATLFVFVILISGVNSENEAELEILKNYAITNYGLDPSTLKIRRFECYMILNHKLCGGGFSDATNYMVPHIWYNANTSKFYISPMYLHESVPGASPKIDREIYFHLSSASPEDEVQIAVTKRTNFTDVDKRELEEIGMTVTHVSYIDEPWKVFRGSHAHGRANMNEITGIANLNWVWRIIYNELVFVLTVDVAEEDKSEIIMSASILSNSVDMPVALKLKTFLENSGFSVHDIFPASTFGNLPTKPMRV
jgi:hypothetical protein